MYTQITDSRDEITTGLLTLDPEGVRARKKPYKKVHGRNFCTPGPNFLWAIDGHHKLTRFGIQIYAAIDAYSRKIIWIYVGHDAITPISVARQFLAAIKETGVVPYRIRSDRGGETPIIADLQYELRRHTEVYSGLILEEEMESFDFDETFLFGTSMKNQRIESWWAKLQGNALRPWKVGFCDCTRCTDLTNIQRWFEYMEKQVGWKKSNAADAVVVLFLLMPIIRQQVYTYMLDWNAHEIRTHRNRPHIIPGVPENIYSTPREGVVDYGEEYHQPTFDRLSQLLDDQSEWILLYTACSTGLAVSKSRKADNAARHRRLSPC
jgi:hypothetical protein